jgi:hypothetical protein
MSVEHFYNEIVSPGLAHLFALGGPRPSDTATQMLLTIALQESALKHRVQRLNSGNPGPARGWWQFERMGGVAGVMQHPSSSKLARALCESCLVPFTSADIWRCLEGHDVLATGFARLLLWTDPRPLPKNAHAGWDYYMDNWRPGKPHPAKWPGYWRIASDVLAEKELFA